jgi:tetratricopeptide (TPR) repeat protein
MRLRSCGYGFLLFSFATISCACVYAQSNRLDSLQQLTPTLTGKQKIDHLNLLIQTYTELGLFKEANVTGAQAVSESKELQYKFGEALAYYHLAITAFYLSDFSSAEDYCQIAIGAFADRSAIRYRARAYVLLGRSVWAQGRFDRANEKFDAANRLFTIAGDSAGLGNTYALMALAEEERGDYEKSLEYSMKAMPFDDDGAFIALGQLYANVGDYASALDYYDQVRDKGLKHYVKLKVGEAYFLYKKYDSAKYYYHSYLSKSNLLMYRLSKPYALLGSLHLELKNYDSALYYLNSALTDFREVNDQNWVMRVTLQLGKTYWETGDRKKAMKLTRELLGMAELSGARQYLRDGHYLLFHIFDSLHANDSAYAHLKTYTTLNNAMGVDASARKLAFYKSTHEREQSRLKIDLLAKGRELQEEELKQTYQQRGFLVVSILGLLVTGIVVVRNTLLKKKNEAHLRELAENELRIQKLEYKKQLGEMEMQVLRTQMSPHLFLIR